MTRVSRRTGHKHHEACAPMAPIYRKVACSIDDNNASMPLSVKHKAWALCIYTETRIGVIDHCSVTHGLQTCLD